MAKLTRYLQKIFANNSNQVGVFGTGIDKETSKNVETLQSADYEDGWSAAIVTNKNYPIWQERDGVDYGFSYQLAYLLQSGIPEWLSTETYYTNSYCRYGSDIYYSLQDNNTNHNPALNDGYWTLAAANINLSNLSNTGKIAIVQNAAPSTTYDNLILGASGATYSAPADGWFASAAAVANGYIGVGGNNISSANKTQFDSICINSGVGDVGVFVPLSKGQDYQVTYGNITAFYYAKFIYAIGNESEAS